MSKQIRHIFANAILRKIVCIVAICVGFVLILNILDNRTQESVTSKQDNNIEIIFSEDVYHYSDSAPTDFLYNESPVQILKNEEFSPHLLAKQEGNVILSEDLIGEFIEENINIDVPSLDHENLDKLYEEDLPEDIIINNLVSEKIDTSKPEDEVKDNKPIVVIVIDDMGISAKRTADIASLKAPITASFLTYAHNLDKQIENSINAGHEIMIHVPMEAQSNKDVAPDVLTTKMTTSEIKNNLQKMLAKFKNIKGANNHMGSKLTEDKERMIAVMEVLKEKNMFFLDSKTSAKSQAEIAAQNVGIGYAHRHVFIDNNNDKQYILKQLQKAENVARKHGYAIAIGHPKSQTYEALKEWIPSLEKKEILLKHLSKIINTPHLNKK